MCLFIYIFNHVFIYEVLMKKQMSTQVHNTHTTTTTTTPQQQQQESGSCTQLLWFACERHWEPASALHACIIIREQNNSTGPNEHDSYTCYFTIWQPSTYTMDIVPRGDTIRLLPSLQFWLQIVTSMTHVHDKCNHNESM